MQSVDSEEPPHREDRGIITMSASWKQTLFHIFLLFICCRRINTKTLGLTPEPPVPASPLPTYVKSVVIKDENQTERIQVWDPINLTLECNWTVNPKDFPNIAGYWTKDGEEIPGTRLSVQLENEQYNLRRDFSISNEENLGNYSCVFGNETKLDFILAVPQISEMRDKPIVSYLEDFVVLQCKMDEKKPKPNNWTWYNGNGTEKMPIADVPQRYEIHNMEWKTQLRISNLSDDDSGLYYCGAKYPIGTSVSRVELKVISIMEPLKPFLTIVAEVLFLVIIILLYERTQARKKTTQEENAQKADQKNELPQGEDKELEGSTSMRHRKV